MSVLYLDLFAQQYSKREFAPCGDYYAVERTLEHTTIILSDGIGSGVKAHVAAILCTSRLQELLRLGFSLRQAFGRVVESMHEIRGSEHPYAVFTVLRVLPRGETTILTYEMPPPLFIGINRHCSVVPARTETLGSEVVAEVNAYLDDREGILLTSDGIVQAGLENGWRTGWGSEGVTRFINDELVDGKSFPELPERICKKAFEISKNRFRDDATVLLLQARRGRTLHVLTGPPADPADDYRVVKEFMAKEGLRAVCGATTSDIVSRVVGKPVSIESNPSSLIAPPKYYIEGIDLVTEGAVTLNQAYNILEADPEEYEPESGVSRLCNLLREADRIYFWVGGSRNVAHGDLSFLQRGILPRQTILPLLAEKLRNQGKLVVLREL